MAIGNAKQKEIVRTHTACFHGLSINAVSGYLANKFGEIFCGLITFSLNPKTIQPFQFHVSFNYETFRGALNSRL